MASALCIATSLLALTTNSLDVLEIGGGILSTCLRHEGFFCETMAAADGYLTSRPADVIKIKDKIDATRPQMLWINFPDHRLRKQAWNGSPQQWKNHDRARRRDLLGAEQLAMSVVNQVHAGKLFAWQCRSDASAGWRHRGIEMIFEAARDKGVDLYDCYVSQCFYERGKPGPWRILTNAKQLYYKLRREGARDILGMRRSLKNRWSRRAWSRTLWMQ